MRTARDSGVRRLLVITYHFPPDGAIGGQRWAGLSKYLARLGWEVHVVTASAPGAQEATPGVHRHFRRRRRILNDVYRTTAARFRRSPNGVLQVPPERRTRARRFSLPNPVAAMRGIFSSSIYLPDDGRGWVERAARAARALLSEHEFDLVVTSGPPHSAHFAGLFATLGRDVDFWIDMRDPWAITHRYNAPNDWLLRGERFLLRRLEALVFPRAARVIVNTREFASALQSSEPALDVICLNNGVDLEQLPPRDLSAVSPGSIAYVGTLYAGRNLSLVCAAMHALLTDRPEAAAFFKLNVAGPMELAHRQRLEDDVAAAGLTPLVSIHGSLPRAIALEMLSRSHLALVLAQNQPLCVPAKLYESVGLGIPTVVIAEATSAAACEARRIGAMTVDGADVEGLRSLLEDMYSGRIPTRIDPKAPVSYEHLALEWDRLLKQSLKGRSDPFQQPVTAPIGNR